jgi:hypothetical protein
MNGGTDAKLEFVCQGEDAIFYGLSSVIYNNTGGASMFIGVGHDSTTTAFSENACTPGTTPFTSCLTGSWHPAAGYHYIVFLIRTDMGTGTWVIDASRAGGSEDPRTTMICSTVRC